jgi:molybdate/tungstate transport system permease protein
MSGKGTFYWVSVSCGVSVLAFILLPLYEMLTTPSPAMLAEAMRDKNVVGSIWLSIYSSVAAACIAFVVGTPLAYVLARSSFRGQQLVESIIDLPIVIPHPVVGIAILSVAGKNHWLGQFMSDVGVRIMGSTTGIITVMVFVGLPFYINAARTGFQSVSPRLEKVARSLGASMWSTFVRITFPLAWRSMLAGFIMCCARAISEFGAIVVVAYHPMTAPVLIYERFEGYGLQYSQPVAVWLVVVCLTLFLVLRMVALPARKNP